MKVLLSGGGTLGPVTPLLGLIEHWRKHNEMLDLLWVGTVNGPEASIVTAQDIRFISIASVKIPRYFTLYWFAMPFLLIYAFVEAWNLLRAERPDVIVTAGGYVSVPLVILGRFMGVKSWVHQQDVIPGLANKIMSRFATKISVTFEDSKSAFPRRKTTLTGNAVRPSIADGSRKSAYKKFGLDSDRKTLLVLGGGGGARWINEAVSAVAKDLTKEWQVLHITGSNKYTSVNVQSDHYILEPMVNDMDDAFAVADVVLCRAGLGTITELNFIGKPAIIVPIPNSHQEMNAFFLYEHQAALILDQTETTPQILLNTIRTIMDNEDVQLRFTANMKLAFPKDGTKRIADGILELAREADSKWSRKSSEKSPLQEFLSDEKGEKLDPPPYEGGDRGGDDIESVDDSTSNELPMSIKEQVARALGGAEIELEEGEDDELPFNVSK